MTEQVSVSANPAVAAVFDDRLCTMGCGKIRDNIYGGMCNGCWWEL